MKESEKLMTKTEKEQLFINACRKSTLFVEDWERLKSLRGIDSTCCTSFAWNIFGHNIVLVYDGYRVFYKFVNKFSPSVKPAIVS